MKAFVLAMLALVVITAASYLVLGEIGFSSAERTTTGASVRLDGE